ncbi:MAG: elongation factor G [Candidatus Eisenbacteria bacterium]|nr:elongation factor G [Candidatus Eisenbacteria bacterium]
MSGGIERIRNIGISAHIDSGKTTLTERILYYTKRIHEIHDVDGKDGVGAKMDSMDLERERGITIQSASTQVMWDDHRVNIIDTPGHVDFTIEVERALRVLDGAVLVLCAVAGVQSQSITVDRQMKRYGVPRIAFINKCDRSGADPRRVTQQLRDRLGHNAVLLQIPIGLEAEHRGVVDLIGMRAILFEGPRGDELRVGPIPEELRAEAEAAREEMLDRLSLHSEELTEAILEDRVDEETIHAAIRAATLDLRLTPVLVGSAYKNKGVQTLLDAVVRYLPSPADIRNEAFLLDDPRERTTLVPDDDAPALGLAFKLEDGPYGQLTYLRVYQGRIARGDTLINNRTNRRVRIGRLVRMHADEMEEIDGAGPGDIVALFGVDCASGDTFAADGYRYGLTSMHVPEPVIALSVRPKTRDAQDRLSRALARFSKEDPTFRTHVDHESSETIISGMGELHLEVYVERLRREYNADVETGQPQVAYREAITRRAGFDYTHKKQTGGAGQYGRVQGYLEPCAESDFAFVSEVKGGNIPVEYIPSCEKGFRAETAEGRLVGFPVVGVRVVLVDGAFHNVDSSDHAFQTAARHAFREAYLRAQPVLLEPIMNLSIEGPTEFQGEMLRTVMQRRGVIIGTADENEFVRVDGEVPLSEMFGYATTLRSATQGKAEFTMEFARYAPVPWEIAKDRIEEIRRRKEGKG